VDYFNPFRNIEIDPALDLEELSKYAHSFGEVVDWAARSGPLSGGIESDAPKSSIQRQNHPKKTYLVAAVFSLALAVSCLTWPKRALPPCAAENWKI